MAKERRKSPRKSTNLDDEQVSFRLEAGAKSFEFVHVNDVSISGAGIRLPVGLPSGLPIKLHFDAEDVNCSVTGRVLWCQRLATHGLRQEADNYNLGVQFDSGNMQSNTLFFMALRRYIDPFGR